MVTRYSELGLPRRVRARRYHPLRQRPRLKGSRVPTTSEEVGRLVQVLNGRGSADTYLRSLISPSPPHRLMDNKKPQWRRRENPGAVALRGVFQGRLKFAPLSRYSESPGPLAPTAATDRFPGQEGKVRKLRRGLSRCLQGQGGTVTEAILKSIPRPLGAPIHPSVVNWRHKGQQSRRP